MFHLTPQERKFVCLVMAVFVIGAFVQLFFRRDIPPVQWVRSVRHFKININTARADQLQMLPGIGAALAHRIMDHRSQNGPFKTLEDLQDVEGLTHKRFDRIKELIEL